MNKVLAITLLSMGISTSAFADDLLTTLAADSDYSTFSKAIKTAGVEDALKAKGPITLFAPNNAAFDKLPKAELKKLMANKEELTKVIEYHIVPGKITSADVAAGKIKTSEGDDLALSVTDGVKVNNAKVVGNQVDADNGAIHTVDTVLIPKKG